VSSIDLVLIVLFVLSAFGGYRRGAILQAFGLVGVVVGVTVGAVLASRAARLAGDDVAAHVGVAVGVVLVGAVIGNTFGWLVGTRVRRHVRGPHASRTDALVGAGLSVIALGLTTWFIALNLASGPFPALAKQLDRSEIVRFLADALPAPPPLLTGIERAADLLGVPEAFAGLPPEPGQPVEPPIDADVRSATSAGVAGTVEVLGDGCGQGVLNEGSGFAVARDYVVTNAHVVAGTAGQTVVDAREHRPATVVLFDPAADVAVLRVPGLSATPLPLAAETIPRGAGGVIVGFPGGPPVKAVAAAVRQHLDATGRDIYGRGELERSLYELQGEVRPGNSGGPFVLADGAVAGVVFASSTLDHDAAYAIDAETVRPLVQASLGRTQPADTQSCLDDLAE
jgi:S1-C subfamily serine protease